MYILVVIRLGMGLVLHHAPPSPSPPVRAHHPLRCAPSHTTRLPAPGHTPPICPCHGSHAPDTGRLVAREGPSEEVIHPSAPWHERLSEIARANMSNKPRLLVLPICQRKAVVA